MKNHKHSKTMMFLLLILTTSCTFAANLIKNPSFTEKSGNLPAVGKFSAWAGTGTCEISSQGRTDSSSVMLECKTPADIAWMQTVKVDPYAKYKLSGWIKTEGLDKKNSFGALLNIHGTAERSQALNGTNDWTHVELEFTSNGPVVRINCLLGGWGMCVGKAWYDDLKLEKIGEVTFTSETIEKTVKITTAKTSEPISKYIYGQFIEHMGNCIYGGIWAEMLFDRKFYFPVPSGGRIWNAPDTVWPTLVASPWQVIGNVSMSEENAYAEKHVPVISPSSDTPAGIYHASLGVVDGKEYDGRIVLTGTSKIKNVDVSLVWGDGEKDRDTKTVVKSCSSKYRTYKFTLKAGVDSENAKLEIVAFGEGDVRVGAVSLMPDDNIKGFRKDTLALLKELNAPVYRWPGGNFVSGYDWHDGLGDRDLRPTRKNPAWTGIETNDMGIDDFVELCKQIGTEPMIAVNTGFGDAYMAANEVEYCNGSSKSLYGNKRANGGNSKPYDVKWWCVGNEMFGAWQLGYMSLDHYTLKHNWVEDMMRKKDPSIVTVGVGDAGKWSKGMLERSSDNMDYLSEHFYCQSRPEIPDHVQQMRTMIKSKAEAHRQYRKDMPHLKGKDIRIAMDEWNYWYGPHLYGQLGTRYYMRDTLGIAAGLHEFFRNSDVCFMANYAQTVNVIGCIKTTKTDAFFAGTAYPLMLYRNEFGTIPVEVDSPSKELDVAAAFTDDKKMLTVGVVNASSDVYKLSLDLDIGLKGEAKSLVIANESPFAYNDENKTDVKIVEGKDTDLGKVITVAPFSITLYKVKVK